MTINYKVFELKNGQQEIAAIVDAPNGETLSTFLYSDVSEFGTWVNQELDSVISGRKECIDISCNACRLVASGDEAIIYDLYAENDDDYQSTRFTIRPVELKQIIDEWLYSNRKINAKE